MGSEECSRQCTQGNVENYRTHPKLHPLVHVSLLVELDEEASARDDERAPVHLALAATHAAERVVLVVAQQSRPPLQRHGLVDLSTETHYTRYK